MPKEIFDLIAAPEVEVIPYKDIQAYAGQQSYDRWDHSVWDGGKFDGGFGATQVWCKDYWTLRMRSAQLFESNIYAQGLVKRLITNEINTGLTPEFIPEEGVLGLEEDSLSEWSENAENRFDLYAKDPMQVDYNQLRTFGSIQRRGRLDALVNGDVLVVLHQPRGQKLPSIELVRGDLVQTPLGNVQRSNDNEIIEGVEIDSRGRHIAYWVDGKRIPARGPRSGRRLAWLVTFFEPRVGEVRGTPLLSIILQSLKELDRYRDSALRKAVVNSILAMFIRKERDKIGSLPVQGAAVRRGSAQQTNNTEDGSARRFNISNFLPGAIIEELQVGEEPVPMSSAGTDINYGPFEEAMVHSMAWSLEIPPEIARLAFTRNYAGSQAAINEFKIYLNRVWSQWGEDFCGPIKDEWLISSILNGTITAKGLLESLRGSDRTDYRAWVNSLWYGTVKPSADMTKLVKASGLMVQEGFSTREREARGLNGSKYSKNIQKLKKENELLAEAMEPLSTMVEDSLEEEPEDDLDLEIEEIADGDISST